MIYRLKYSPRFERKLGKIDVSFAKRLAKKIEEVLINPLNKQNKLRAVGGSKNLYKIKFMSPSYRVLYKVEGDVVTFLDMDSRDKVYKALSDL